MTRTAAAPNATGQHARTKFPKITLAEFLADLMRIRPKVAVLPKAKAAAQRSRAVAARPKKVLAAK